MDNAETAWKSWHTVSLLGLLAAPPLIAIRFDPLTVWFFTLLSLTLFTLICGQGVSGFWRGAFIDNRNVMSLSRFQIVIWTLLVLSAYLAAAISNSLDVKTNPDPLNIGIDPTLWLLMGISTTSLVGSPLLLSTKFNKAADPSEQAIEFELLQRQGDAPGSVDAKGQIVVTNILESIVLWMRQYGDEMQKNIGRPQALARGASGNAAASGQGDS